VSEDCHSSNNAGENRSNMFPACTPEQNQALARLRYLSNIQVQDETTVYYADETQESGKIPGYVLGDWAKIDAEIAELERLARL
jgi:hypothetical protein